MSSHKKSRKNLQQIELIQEDSQDEDDELYYLNYEDHKAINKLKKTNKTSYKNFKEVRDIIKSREISLIQIINSTLSNEKKANLIEKYQCLCRSEQYTEEYIDLRDSIRNSFYSYLSEQHNVFFEEAHHNERKVPENEIAIFRKKIKDIDCSPENSKVFEEKMQELEENGKGDERSKIKRWINLALCLPFDKITEFDKDLNVNEKLKNIHDFLNKELYGMKNVKERIMLFLNKKLKEGNSKGCNIALVGNSGVGKCHGLNTPIIMFDGTIKMIQDIKVGDQLMGDDSTPRNVLSLARGREKMFKVKQIYGDSYIVNQSHILSLKEYYPDDWNKIVDIPLTEYNSFSLLKKSYFKGYKVSIDFKNNQKVPFDPYIVGLWLGDTISKFCGISIRNNNILKYVSKNLEKYGLFLEYPNETNSYTLREYLYFIKHDNGDESNSFLKFLKDYDLLSIKYLPLIYKTNDKNIRIKVLAGIIDSHLTKKSIFSPRSNWEYYIDLVNDKLADDILFLARSLGFIAKRELSGYINKITISGANLKEIPLLGSSYPWNASVDSTKSQIKQDNLITDIQIEPLNIDDYYGFEIDGNNRYLLGDFTVTHNTKIAKCLSKCLGLPFAQLNFGGVTHSDFLTGHDYTYVGSRPGEISRCLTRMGSKNGILFLDEFGRACEHKEIMSTLLHITDFSQNFEFRDSYFPELTQDLSKLWFIYSTNELPTDPAMLDRLEVINVSDYTSQEREVIARDFVIPKFIKELNLENGTTIEFTDDAIKKIVQKSGEGNKGVRDLERIINLVLEKVYFYICNSENSYDYNWYKKMEKSNVISSFGDSIHLTIKSDLVEEILADKTSREQNYLSMWL